MKTIKQETAHTPGPWKHERRGDTIQSLHPDYQFSLIAQIATGENRREEDANAALIAAAPDLFQACRAVVAHDGDLITQADWFALRDACRLAITKTLPAPKLAMATESN